MNQFWEETLNGEKNYMVNHGIPMEISNGTTKITDLSSSTVQPFTDSLHQVQQETQDQQGVVSNLDRNARPFKCEICGKCFQRSNYVKIHLRTHTGEKPYSCMICGAQFAGLSSHHRHMIRHSGIKAHKCESCGKCFVLKEQLIKHSYTHTGYTGKTYGCDVCQKEFRYPHLLKYHYRIHTGERPFKCAICGTSFRSTNNLYSHRRYSHSQERPEKCSYCEMTFKTRNELRKHERKHTGQKPVKPHMCEICNKSFIKKHNFESHKLTHSTESSVNFSKLPTNQEFTEKKFQCSLCERKFCVELSRQLHENMVHNVQNGIDN